MQHIRRTIWILLWTLLAIVLLVGCHAKADNQQLDEWEKLQGPGQMKAGPGLISGEEGKFTIYSSKKSASASTEKETAAAGAQGPAADTRSAETPAGSKEYQEFQEFQQWQKEKEQFREYLEWKKAAEGTPEYEEFLKWKEFRDYQEWQKNKQK